MVTEHYTCIGHQRLIVLGITMVCVTFPVFAGDWKIAPTLAVNETATDNVALTNTQKQSDLITDITPGISINGSGGRSKLRLNYQLHNLIYANESSRNQTQNSLNALGTLEAVDNWFFIDASGSISQQSISAFGAAPISSNVNTNANNNITETSTYLISPYIRGSLGSLADYQLRYSLSSTSSQAGTAFDSTTQTWLGSLQGKTRLANLGWSVDINAVSTDQGNLRSKEDNQLHAALTYQINPQFQVSLIGGREEQSYINLQKQANSTNGAGFVWSPTERTKMEFKRVNRFFGPSNTFSFSHRTALTAWTMSASKEVTSQQSQGSAGLGANYDLLYSLTPNTLDPVARAALVNDELLRRGLSPNVQLQGGFQTNQAVVQQLRQISFALLGVRNTVTFSATQNSTENLSVLNQVVPIGSGPSQNNVDQFGASINWSHQLSPLSSLIGSIARSNSKGTGLNNLETTQEFMSMNFVTQLGPKTNAGLGARRVVFDGSGNGATSYTENAVTGVLSHQF